MGHRGRYKFCAITLLMVSFFKMNASHGQISAVDTLEMDSGRVDVTQNGKSNWGKPLTVSLNYQYGVPEVVMENDGMHFYDASVELDLDIKGIPFIFSGKYSSHKSYSGIGSFFKVSLDVEELQERKRILESKILDSLRNRIGELDKQIFDLESKIAFIDAKKNARFNFKERKSDIGLENFRDSVPEFDAPTKPPTDSIKVNTQGFESILNNQYDANYEDYVTLDSLRGQLEQLKIKKKMFQSQFSLAEEFSSEHMGIHDGLLSKKGGIFNLLKHNTSNFGIGLVSPSNSKYLLAGVPLFGVHIETGIDNIYLSASAGQINNPRSRRQRRSTESTSFLNNFGFPLGGTIYNGIQVKGGIGFPHESHVHVGWLGAREDNHADGKHSVIEINSLLKLSNVQVELAVAKSGVQQTSGTGRSENSGSSVKSTDNIAGKGSLHLPIRATKTNISASGELWGGEFFSPGLGYQRAGLVTYKMEANQKLGKRSSFKAYLERDLDGLLVTQFTKNVFTRWGIELTRRVGKALVFKTGFSPISQHIEINRDYLETPNGYLIENTDSISAINSLTDSYLVNFTTVWGKRIEDVSLTALALFQYYSFGTAAWRNDYALYSGSFSADFSQKITATLSGTWLQPHGNTVQMSERVTLYCVLNYNVDAGLSVSGSIEESVEGGKMFFGYSGMVDFKISKNLRAGISAQKITNDYFSQTFLDGKYAFDNPFRIKTTLTWALD